MSIHPGQAVAGRMRIAALVALALAAMALYLYSERAVPPESPEAVPSQRSMAPDSPPQRDPSPETYSESQTGESFASPGRSGDYDRVGLDDRSAGAGDVAEADAGDSTGEDGTGESRSPAAPSVSIEQAGARLRIAVAERVEPGQLDWIVSARLIERLVATVNSLDGVPVPLRFRPLAHVPDLPRVVGEGESLRLPAKADPRYAAYRDLFERFDAATLAALFERHEAAFDAAWRALGETSTPSFRVRLLEVLDHLATFEVPAERPRLIRPEVLYEFFDPELEAASWGRKLLIRIGPEHAAAVQQKALALAEALRRSETSADSPRRLGPGERDPGSRR